MATPLYLSAWLAGYSPLALPVYFRKALAAFPHSKLAPGSVLRVYALSFQETPVFEGFIDGEMDADAARETARLAEEHLNEDCCFQLETRWDLMRWDGSWSLGPSKVTIEVYGPLFDRDLDDHLRLTLGNDSLFLPQPESDQLRPVQSNIRSVLHLALDLDEALTLDHRLLWSEEDDNFAERLALLVDDGSTPLEE